MPAVWLRFRAELRTRWRALLAVALLVGLAGGAALAAFAGARRTDTAFDRLLATTEAPDLLVNPHEGTESALDLSAIAALPEVSEVGRVNGVFVGPAHPRSFSDFFDFGMTLATDDVAMYDIARPKLVSGRMPRRDRPGEVLIDPLMARQQGWRVGNRVDFIALSTEEGVALEETEPTPENLRRVMRAIRAGDLGEPFTATITGIGVFPDQVVVDEGFENGQLVLGPGFLRRHPDTAIGYWGATARLRHGAADETSVRRRIQQLVPDEAFAFQSTAKLRTKVERAVRPSVGALTIFAVVIALTGLLVIGQALARQTFLDSADNETLHALGVTRGQLFAAAMLRAVVIALVGAMLAVALAVVASPLTPIGVARTAEPDPGIDVAWSILAGGLVLTFVVVVLLAAWPAWRNARQRGDVSVARPSRLAATVADAGLSVPAAAGVRMALEPGRGRTAVPVRTTIIGAAMAIATVVAAGVFAASLDHLVSTPRLFGWNWDSHLSVSAESEGEAEVARGEIADMLDASPQVSRWGTVSLSELTLDGASMPAVGIDLKRGAALPTLVDGSLPRRPGEIALGRLSQRTLGVGTGDRVTARDNNGDDVQLKVVGTVVLPGLATYPGQDKTSLGEGAVVTRDELYELGPNFGSDDFVVQFAPSATAHDRDGVLGKAEEIVARVDPEGFGAGGVQRPSDIVAYDHVRSTRLVLALVLAVLASATVAHALISAVRRRRRDLALLATLGLTRRQISSTVAWQSTTVGALALVIGVPLGIVGGRWAWGLLADDLGTLSEPRVPILAIAIGFPAVLLLCNAVAYVPGRIAARMKPAVVLRSE